MESYPKTLYLGFFGAAHCGPHFYADIFCQRRRIMAIFKGAGVAIVTPMYEDGTVNYDKLAQLLDEQVAAGTDAIIICGTTGESATLTEEEHIEVIRFAVEKIAKRIPVIAGTGSNCTSSAIYLSQEAEKAGADGLLLVTPYYNKATQNGLIAHYTKIAESVSLPIILYNVPSRTGCNIQPETAVALVKNVKNIVGIKEASGNISQVAKLMSLAADIELDLYSGNDDQIVPIMALGGKGVISVLSNVAPAQTHEIVASYLEGDVKKSCELQLQAIELIDALFCEVNPIPVKTALNLMGKEVGPLRMPLSPMGEANQQRLEKAMKNYGIL
jgi:4-hydroxy-tetrahydrodipicolinate synthase